MRPAHHLTFRELDGDVATGRAYIQELARILDGRQGGNYAVYHDRYQRTDEGWKFTERIYEVRYLDPTPLSGAAPTLGLAQGDVAEGITSPQEARK